MNEDSQFMENGKSGLSDTNPNYKEDDYTRKARASASRISAAMLLSMRHGKYMHRLVEQWLSSCDPSKSKDN